jgi:hypothetical protein
MWNYLKAYVLPKMRLGSMPQQWLHVDLFPYRSHRSHTRFSSISISLVDLFLPLDKSPIISTHAQDSMLPKRSKVFHAIKVLVCHFPNALASSWSSLCFYLHDQKSTLSPLSMLPTTHHTHPPVASNSYQSPCLKTSVNNLTLRKPRPLYHHLSKIHDTWHPQES